MSQAIGSLNGPEIVSRINLSPEGTRIDGKLLHVTGQALFENNIITEGMLQANSVNADKIQALSISSDKLQADSVTADKLKVNRLDTITATIGTLRTKTSGARVEISDNLIQVFDDNNVLRVRLGLWDD